MKSDHGSLDPVLGFGFLVIVLANFLMGAAALKYLAQDTHPRPTHTQTTQTRNVCWFFCRQGGGQ